MAYTLETNGKNCYIIDLHDNSEIYIEHDPIINKWFWHCGFITDHIIPGSDYDKFDSAAEAAIAGLQKTAWYLAGKICDCHKAIENITKL